MLILRRNEDRGIADFGWLYSRHSFSFGHYYDPQHMGFAKLRVIYAASAVGSNSSFMMSSPLHRSML